MLHHLPKQLPPIELMLEDLGSPTAKQLAKALGVCERTARRYKRGEASRTAQLALFWLTQWGQSQLNTRALNEVALYRGYCEALKSDNERLKAEMDRLATLGEFGAANDPSAMFYTHRTSQRLMHVPAQALGETPVHLAQQTTDHPGCTEQLRGVQRG